MGLSVFYQLCARGDREDILARMQDWQGKLRGLPIKRVSEIRNGLEEIAFDVHCGDGAEIARMRMRAEASDIWRGSWDCKTQFAGRPQYGGPAHFLSTHRCLIAALDIGHALGLVESVFDDGCFWDGRQDTRLLARFEQHENALASMVALVRSAGLIVPEEIPDSCRP